MPNQAGCSWDVPGPGVMAGDGGWWIVDKLVAIVPVSAPLCWLDFRDLDIAMDD